jgi:hypothetical protein
MPAAPASAAKPPPGSPAGLIFEGLRLFESSPIRPKRRWRLRRQGVTYFRQPFVEQVGDEVR